MEVPTLNGEILGRRTFWDMFRVSMYEQECISDSEKLLYLHQAVANGPATQVIEDLSHSGYQYKEAIACLQTRYDQPRSIPEAYVKSIVEFPKLKDGSGKELYKLHDTMIQNL